MMLFQSHPEIFGLLDSPFLTSQLNLRPLVYESFLSLQEKASKVGINLQSVSTYRNFEAQKNIWNLKATGQRTLLDSNGVALDFEYLESFDIIKAILRWSAFPGLSRHHWGTDLDVIDQHYLDKNPSYNVELIPSEYQEDGPFEELGRFLEHELNGCDFFRPYQDDRGGVAPEAWHLSHVSSVDYFKAYQLQDFLDFLNGPKCQGIVFLEVVKENAEFIFKNYFQNISHL